MAPMPAPASSARPLPVTLAVVLSALAILGNAVAFAIESGTVPQFVLISDIVVGVVGIAAVIGLWLRYRWGVILTVLVAARNLIFAVPNTIGGATVAIQLFWAVFALVGAVILVLVLLPDARRSYR